MLLPYNCPTIRNRLADHPSDFGSILGFDLCTARLHKLRKIAKQRHSERSEESLLDFCFEPGGILRFAQNDNQSTFPQTVRTGICLNLQCRPKGERYKSFHEWAAA
jgi:hypothetical protein